MKARRILSALVCAVILCGCAGPARPVRPDGTEVTMADAGPPPADRDAVVKGFLRQFLKDPLSAQIDGIAGPVFIRRNAGIWGPAAFGWGICFNVNAKNSFGAYTGFRPMALIWRQGQVIASQGDMSDNSFDRAFASNMCQFIRNPPADRLPPTLK